MSDVMPRLKKAICEGEDDLAFELAQTALREGTRPLDIVNGAIIAGIQEAGELWKKNIYFHSDMIMSAEAFRRAMEIVEPRISAVDAHSVGSYLIGTVAGDMHNLGKMMVVAMLRGGGFRVTDLGEDVPTETFLAKVEEMKPDVLGLGCYMTTTMTEMETIIKRLKELGLRDGVKVMVGGVPLSQEYADKIGADAWGKDALDAVEKALQLVKAR